MRTRGVCSSCLSLLLLLLSFDALVDSARGQSVWVFGQRNSLSENVNLGDYTLASGIVGDPIPAGKRIREFAVPEIRKASDPNDGGIAIDRFDGRVWITNGDKNHLEFLSVPMPDPQGRTPSGPPIVVNQFQGSYPFLSNITGIAIAFGRDGRPKLMWCLAFNLYSYLDMRRTPWQWAGQAWAVPNGGIPLNDIAFCYAQREIRRGVWQGFPALIGVEPASTILVWDAVHPELGLFLLTGAGLWDPTGVAVDTSKPLQIRYDDSGPRRMSGRILCFGRLGTEHVIRDLDFHTIFQVEVSPNQRFRGMDYSAEIVDLIPFVDIPVGQGKVERDLGEIRMRVNHRTDVQPETPSQPVMPVRPGVRARIRVEAPGLDENAVGMRAYLVMQFNKLNLIQSDDGESPLLVDINDPYLTWKRGVLDRRNRSMYVDLDPRQLPASPLTYNEEFVFFMQWIFVPERVGFGSTPSDLVVSHPFRFAFSNPQ